MIAATAAICDVVIRMMEYYVDYVYGLTRALTETHVWFKDLSIFLHTSSSHYTTSCIVSPHEQSFVPFSSTSMIRYSNSGKMPFHISYAA